MEKTLKEFLKETGLKVKAARLEKNIPQKLLAQAANVHVNTISRVELGQMRMPTESIDTLCTALGKSKAYFNFGLLETLDRFAKVVQEERIGRELSREELANKLKKDSKFVNNIERGTIIPDQELLNDLGRIFAVDTSFLWDTETTETETFSSTESRGKEEQTGQQSSAELQTRKARSGRKSSFPAENDTNADTTTNKSDNVYQKTLFENTVDNNQSYNSPEEEVISTHSEYPIYNVAKKREEVASNSLVGNTDKVNNEEPSNSSDRENEKQTIQEDIKDSSAPVEKPTLEQDTTPNKNTSNGMRKLVLEFPEDYGDIVITIKRDRS